MAFSEAQLTAVEEAIAAGTLSVSYDGKSITYRSMADLVKARDLIRQALTGTGGPQMIPVRYRRG